MTLLIANMMNQEQRLLFKPAHKATELAKWWHQATCINRQKGTFQAYNYFTDNEAHFKEPMVKRTFIPNQQKLPKHTKMTSKLLYTSSHQKQRKPHNLCVPVFNHHLSSCKSQNFICDTRVVGCCSDKIQFWLQQYTTPTLQEDFYHEICTLLGFYAAKTGSVLPMYPRKAHISFTPQQKPDITKDLHIIKFQRSCWFYKKKIDNKYSTQNGLSTQWH